MKLLAAILVFMITAQPVQAGFCDMQPSGDSAAHAGMQHGGMQHDTQEDGRQGHDCCAPADEDGSRDCDNMVQCGTCSVATAAVAVEPAIAPVPEWALRSYLNGSGVPPSHASPPYRPPIFIS
jgi:DNA-binding transcriptional LysR family regulator